MATTLVLMGGIYTLFVIVLPVIRYLVLLIRMSKDKEINYKESVIEIVLSIALAVCVGLILRSVRL